MSYAEALLSKELFELSDWEGEGEHFGHYIKDEWIETTPKYSLGYLLRKLNKEVEFRLWGGGFDGEYIAYAMPSKNETVFKADTPEDAAAKLAIELFKQNILTRKDDL